MAIVSLGYKVKAGGMNFYKPRQEPLAEWGHLAPLHTTTNTTTSISTTTPGHGRLRVISGSLDTPGSDPSLFAESKQQDLEALLPRPLHAIIR